MALVDLSNLGLTTSAQNRTISASDLLDQYNDKGLFVLGFILQIMKKAERDLPTFLQSSVEEEGLRSWMGFYANELGGFDCSPVSIAKFQKESARLIIPFCVFLDEFLTDPWCGYVCNLILAVGCTCIVSNTNASITNLSVKDTKSSRTIGVNQGWSLVFRRLDNVNLEVLGLDLQNLSLIKEHCARTASAASIFDKLFGEWLSKSRPGIAVAISSALNELLDCLKRKRVLELTQSQSVPSRRSSLPGTSLSLKDINLLEKTSTIEGLLLHVSINTANYLISRKTLMVNSLNGQLAKLGLLADAAYFDANFIKFLECHLYYLKNPCSLLSQHDMFLTFVPSGSNHLRIFKEKGLNVVEVEEWAKELTYFRNDELFTFLTCSCIKLNCSPNKILNEANEERMTENIAIGNLQNSNAIKLSGNHLEAAAAMTCADASHHSSGVEPIFTFGGVDGKTWSVNVLANCSLEKETFKTKKFL